MQTGLMNMLGNLDRHGHEVSRLERFTMAIGLFAVVTVGVHHGADQLDEIIFWILNFVDRGIDAALAFLISKVLSWFSVSAPKIDTIVFSVVDWINVDVKLSIARYAALCVELLVVVMLALPFMIRGGGPRDAGELKNAFSAVFRDPTVLRWALPSAVLLASIAGVAVMSTQMQVQTFSSTSGLFGAAVAGFLGKVVGVFALVAGGVFLAARATVNAVVRADKIDFELRRLGAKHRRLSGMFTLLIALPVAVLAVLYGTPLLAGVRAIFVG